MNSSIPITAASKAKKLLFILIDGLADLPIDELGGKTPLQHAQIPWMDKLAESGINGIMDPVAPGVTCESDQAHMSILGYDPHIITDVELSSPLAVDWNWLMVILLSNRFLRP